MQRLTVFILSFLWMTAAASAFDWNLISGPREVWIGPEAYHVKRTRSVGSQQEGWLYGVRGNLERICPSSLYWGIEGYYASGCIDGNTKQNTHVESHMSDADIEGRIGATFAWPLCGCLSFTPFTGGGYFWNDNQFHKPDDFRFHFKDAFGFWTLGFQTQWNFASAWSIGLRFKSRFMFCGRSRVSNDSLHPNRTLTMGNRAHYDVDLPLSYWTCLCNTNVGVSLVPFYRFRQYGERKNYPFDFFSTQFIIWGIRAQINCVF